MYVRDVTTVTPHVRKVLVYFIVTSLSFDNKISINYSGYVKDLMPKDR